LSLAALAAFFTDDPRLAACADAEELFAGLAERGLVSVVDGRADVGEVRAALKTLGAAGPVQRAAVGASAEDMLGRAGAKLDGHSLASFDRRSDSFSLVIVASERLAELQALAAVIAPLVVHRAAPAARKKSPSRPAGLREQQAWQAQPLLLLALPDGRAVSLEREQVLCVYTPEGVERLPVWDLVMPGVAARSPMGQVSLFSSGGGFGVLSSQRVLWFAEGRLDQPTVLTIAPALPLDRFGRSAAPSGIGISDEAGFLACAFHEPGNLPSSSRLGLFRLGDGVARREGEGELPTWRRDDFPVAPGLPAALIHPLMDGLARLGGRTLGFLKGLGSARDYSLLAEWTPAGGQTRLALAEPTSGRFSSSGRFLILDSQDKRKPGQELHDLGEGKPHALGLGKYQRVLDHAGDHFWLQDGARLLRCGL
jgi:hypothetical protein